MSATQARPQASIVIVTKDRRDELLRAVRSAVAQEPPRVGGFRTLLVHQAEEPDLCIRLLNEGFVVRLGRSEPILHHGSPRRDVGRIQFYGCRNDVVSEWHYAPASSLPYWLLKVTLHEAWLGLRACRPFLHARALFAGNALSPAQRRDRSPVRATSTGSTGALASAARSSIESSRGCLSSMGLST